MDCNYKELPCDCGFTYKDNPDQYEIYEMNMGKIMGQDIGKKKVPRCKTCEKISIIEKQTVAGRGVSCHLNHLSSIRIEIITYLLNRCLLFRKERVIACI